MGLEGNLRLRRLSGERKRLGRHGMRQEGLGLQAVRGGLRLAVERRLRVGLRGGRGRLALSHAQGLQGRVRRRQSLRVQSGGLLDVRMRRWWRGGLGLAGGLGCRRRDLRRSRSSARGCWQRCW